MFDWYKIKNCLYRNRTEYLLKKQKLIIFLDDIMVINDFEHILTKEEYYLLLIKSKFKSWDLTFKNIQDNYLGYGDILGGFSLKKLYKLYFSSINKILPEVHFRLRDYNLEIVYDEKKGLTNFIDLIKDNNFEINNNLIATDKILKNRVLEAQKCGGLHDSPMRSILEHQNQCILEMEEKDEIYHE